MNEPIFSIKNCTYNITVDENSIQILKGISCDIPKQAITLVTGRSGSGKTTLLNCLSGLIVPQHGDIFFEKDNISKLSPNQRAQYRLKNTGVMYQSFNFLPSLSIKENIILPAIMNAKDIKKYTGLCLELSSQLGIINQLDSYPQSVSGGELQRATLVRSLINEPKIILADEPTGNLDTKNRDIIFNTFQAIKKEKKMSIIFTSHDPAAKDIADHIIELNDGALVNSNVS